MRMTATITVAALFLFALASPAGNAEEFGIEPDRKLDRALERLADVMYECGDMAKGKGLYTYTRSFFNHGLAYNPDHRGIRRTMGFRKRGGEWVRDEDMVPKEDKINEAERQEIVRKLNEQTEPLRRKAAEALFEDFVADEELALEQRLLALHHVLRLYPAHRGAQKAARTSTDDGRFKHELDHIADVNRVVWIGRGDKGSETEELTDYERAMGYDMPSRRNDWLVVHVDVTLVEKSEKWAETLIQYADACRMRNFAMLGLDEPESTPEQDAHRLHYTVFDGREEFSSFVERCSGIPDASERRARAKSGGTPVYNPYGAVWLYPNTDNDFGLRDAIAHDLAYKEVIRHTRSENLYWLPRGIAYLAGAKMNGSVHSRFYAVRSSGVFETGGAEALPGLGNSPAGWRLQAGLHVAGKTAPGVEELTGKNPKEYTRKEMAAAFCLAEFLIAEHQESLAGFLKDAHAEGIKRQKENERPESSDELLKRLLETLEMDEEALTNAYHQWVLDNVFDLDV